jgi:hypothetical protein
LSFHGLEVPGVEICSMNYWVILPSVKFLDDIPIVASYNAQVTQLKQRLQNATVGTVDRLQGQEVPGGMEFSTVQIDSTSQPLVHSVSLYL